MPIDHPLKVASFKVLIPTDFTEFSRNAVRYVLQAFPRKVTHIYLLHAYKDSMVDVAPMITLLDILREKSERMMLSEMKFVASLPHPTELIIVPISRYEGLVEAIGEITRTETIDLVVMGSNGEVHPRLEKRENEPAYLLHKFNLPILLVPKLLN